MNPPFCIPVFLLLYFQSQSLIENKVGNRCIKASVQSQAYLIFTEVFDDAAISGHQYLLIFNMVAYFPRFPSSVPFIFYNSKQQFFIARLITTPELLDRYVIL